MLKRPPPSEKHEMLPHYEGVYKPKNNNIDFESAREILMKEDYKMVVKRRFEKIYNMMECKSYMRNEDISENKEIIVYGSKDVKTDKVDKYILIGCELGELHEKDKLINLWSNKFVNEEIETRKFKLTGRTFLTLVKRNHFPKIHSIVL